MFDRLLVPTDGSERACQAAEQRVEVIAMATRDRTGVRRLLSGSVTERALRRAGVPVLAVPE